MPNVCSFVLFEKSRCGYEFVRVQKSRSNVADCSSVLDESRNTTLMECVHNKEKQQSLFHLRALQHGRARLFQICHSVILAQHFECHFQLPAIPTPFSCCLFITTSILETRFRPSGSPPRS